MSQKYKSFSRGNGYNSTSSLSSLPGVKRMGYLRKLKKMKRRFFVLHMESNYGIARLEYYSSEKKWKFGCEPRRCIELKSCLNISRKLHSKHKNVIALYTQDDCFSVVTETAEELELWLNDLLEVQQTFIEIDENATWRPIYDHLWQVQIDKHDIEDGQLLVGPYRVALSSKSLFLIKMNPLIENDYFEFPLMSIRRCGHSKDHFFVELGRSSVIGAGEIYMATEGTIIAQNMHETVLSAMKSSKIREDGNPFPRLRSASTSDSFNTVATRRPIAPQTVSSSISSCGLSSSRERCDSLPNRTQTMCSHNCVLSALSSPYASSGPTLWKLNSRPHSMYEWPSCNSPSARNASFSPSSLSTTTVYSSSTEEIDKMKLCLSYSQSTAGRQFVECGISEKSDEYLKTCPSEDINLFRKEENASIDHESFSNHEKHFELENVLSLLKIEEGVQSTLSYTLNNGPNIIMHEKNAISGSPTTHISNPDSSQLILNNNAVIGAKPPLPEKTYQKTENRSGPPSPLRREELPRVTPGCKNSVECRSIKSDSMELQNKEDLSLDISNKNSELDDQDVFYNACDKIKQKSVICPGQNTNFSCLNDCERSNSHSLLPCAPICSVTKASNSFKQRIIFNRPQNDIDKVQFSPKESTNKFSITQDACDNNNLKVHLPTNSLVPTLFQSKSFIDSVPSNDKNSNISSITDKLSNVSESDYVNFHINSHPIKPGYVMSKNSSHLLPLCADSNHPDYSNIQFGKPFCPTPKPAMLNNATKNEWPFFFPNYSKLNGQKADCAPMPQNIPTTLPAFRKQMSAPACPLAPRPELPGRKSSCPVTASASMIRPPLPTPSIHLCSPDHSSASSCISSASDEISSAHSSPKARQADGQYENVAIPQRRPPSTSSEEKELNYALLDLGPSEDRSPTIHKTMDNKETSTYVEIDFTKSEGLKNTSGSLREGRL